MTSPSVHAESVGRLLRLWVITCGIAAALLVLSQLVEIPVRSALRGYDNTFNYLWLRSAMVDGDWDFRNDLEQCDTLVAEQRASAEALPVTKVGRIPNKYGIGWAVTTLPFYVMADGCVGLARAAGLTSLQCDGFNPVYQVFIQVGHGALALLALLLTISTITTWTGSRTAAIAGVLLVWAASPLLYYQTANVSMSHGAVFFWITVYGWAVVKARRETSSSRFWILAGAALGMAVITRFQTAVFGLVAVWIIVAQTHSCRRFAVSASCVVAGSMPFVAIQMYAWHAVYGDWLVFSYGGEGEVFRWAEPELVNVLFSSWHGLFYWHPFLIVAAALLFVWGWWERRDGLPWMLAFALTAYVNASWWCWWFASSFGNRAFDAALLPLMGGVAWAFARGGDRVRKLLWILGIAAGAWNFYVVLLYRSGAISRHAPVTWLEMIQAAGRLRDAIQF